MASASDAPIIGAKPVGSSINDTYVKHAVSLLQWFDVLIPIDANNQVQLTSSTINGKVFLEAEFGGDDVYTTGDYIALTLAEAGNAWADYDLTTTLNGLAAAGITGFESGTRCSVLLYAHTDADGHWVYRQNGGVYNVHESEPFDCSQIGCVQLDEDDIWENYVAKVGGSQASTVYIVGLIKNFVSHDPADQTWAGGANEWITQDITTCNNASSGTNDYVYGRVALVRFRNTYGIPAFTLFGRAIGSSNDHWYMQSCVRDLWIEVNSDQEFEAYRNNVVTTNYEVKGFYLNTFFLNLDGTAGEINKKNGSIAELNKKNASITKTNGFRNATENFSGEAIGASGTDIDWIDWWSGSGNVEIVKEIDGHKNVILFTIESSFFTSMHYFTDGLQNSGIREFYIRGVDTNENSVFEMRENNTIRFVLSFDNGNLYYQGNQGRLLIMSADSNKWYHIKLQWYSDSTFDIYVNRTLKVDGASMIQPMTTGLDRFAAKIWHTTAYLNAWGSSADECYTEGDNLTMELGGKDGSIEEI